jgi:hypothetical protein
MINKKAEGSPLFNEAPCHEGVRILTSVLNWDEWSASIPGRFTCWTIASGTHWTAGWLNLKAGLDAVDEKTSIDPAGNGTPVPRASSS